MNRVQYVNPCRVLNNVLTDRPFEIMFCCSIVEVRRVFCDDNWLTFLCFPIIRPLNHGMMRSLLWCYVDTLWSIARNDTSSLCFLDAAISIVHYSETIPTPQPRWLFQSNVEWKRTTIMVFLLGYVSSSSVVCRDFILDGGATHDVRVSVRVQNETQHQWHLHHPHLYRLPRDDTISCSSSPLSVA